MRVQFINLTEKKSLWTRRSDLRGKVKVLFLPTEELQRYFCDLRCWLSALSDKIFARGWSWCSYPSLCTMPGPVAEYKLSTFTQVLDFSSILRYLYLCLSFLCFVILRLYLRGKYCPFLPPPLRSYMKRRLEIQNSWKSWRLNQCCFWFVSTSCSHLTFIWYYTKHTHSRTYKSMNTHAHTHQTVHLFTCFTLNLTRDRHCKWPLAKCLIDYLYC